MTTVWIYVDTRYPVGHLDHLKVFATRGRGRMDWEAKASLSDPS
jgi:hypothetical protein